MLPIALACSAGALLANVLAFIVFKVEGRKLTGRIDELERTIDRKTFTK